MTSRKKGIAQQILDFFGPIPRMKFDIYWYISANIFTYTEYNINTYFLQWFLKLLTSVRIQ